MNRVTRLAASLRRPALRVVTSYCIKSCSCYAKQSLFSGYGQTVGTVATAATCACLGFSLVGFKGILWLWLIAEILFIAVNAARCWHFNGLRTPAVTDLTEIRFHFERFLRSLQHLDAESHLRDWFLNAEFASLPEENVRELVAYAFAFQNWNQNDKQSELSQLLRQLLDRFEAQTGIRLKEGYRPNVQFRSHLWNNVPHFHYPLTLYCIFEALGVIFTCMMALAGFLCSEYRGRRYFVRAGSTSQKPILFLHGLGLGPISYLPFIRMLCQLEHPIFVIELRHLSMRVCFQTPSIDDIVNDIMQILELHRLDECVVVGHSYGTFIASRLNALHPKRIAGLCMMDPVCCVMHNPKLLSTFVYRTLSWRHVGEAMTSFLVTFIGHDPSIATSVCRQFRWMELNLWPEDIPEKTILVISEADMLVPVEDVKRVFRQTHAKLLVHPSHSHGSFLVDDAWQQAIVRQIRETFRQ